MMIILHPNQIGLLIGAILSIMVLLVGWPRRKTIGGIYFVAFSFSVTWWLISSAAESIVVQQSSKILWSQISYIGFTQCFPYLFLFVVSYIRQRNFHISSILALMVIPFITVVLAWTNSWHGWLWPGYSQGSAENNVLIYQHGFWFWVHVVYLYSVMLAGLTYLIISIIKAQPAFRRQLWIILAGVIFPIITGTMYVSGLEPVPGMDITPTGLVFTGLFFALGLLRYQLLDLLPVARTALVEQLQDGVIVLDLRWRIVDINQATQNLLNWNPKTVIGQELARISPELAGLVSDVSGQTRREISFPDPISTILEVQSSTLFSEAHQEIGKLWVLRDITERRQSEDNLRASESQYQSLYAAAKRSEQERNLLDRVSFAIAHELDLPITLRLVVEAIAETLGYTLVSLYLLKDENLVLQNQVGYARTISTIPINQGVTGRVVRTGQPVLLENVHTDPAFLEAIEEIVSEVCVPLVTEGKVIGVMNIESTQGVHLSVADLNLMSALSEHVSVAISRSRLYTQVREKEERYRKFIQHATEAIYIYNGDTHQVQDANPAFLHLLGYTLEEANHLSIYDIVASERAEIDRQYAVVMEKGSALLGERKWRRKDGNLIDVYETVSTVHQADQTTLFVLAQDITERKRIEQELQTQRDFATQIINTMGQGLTVTDADGRFEYVNPAYVRLFGFNSTEMIGTHPVDETTIEGQALLEQQKNLRQSGQTITYETGLRRADGSIAHVLITDVPRGRDGQFAGQIAVITDLTEQKRIENELRHAKETLETVNAKLQAAFAREQVFAYMDELTGINNRRSLFELADREFKIAMRYRTQLTALMYDIDDFKLINDTFGHAIGDQVLKLVTQSVSSKLRSVDILGRYGGDEFVILLPQTSAEEALPLAQRIQACIAAMCMETEKGSITLTVSLGIAQTISNPARGPGQSDTMENLFLRVDQALYAAKQAGKNRAMIFDPDKKGAS